MYSTREVDTSQYSGSSKARPADEVGLQMILTKKVSSSSYLCSFSNSVKKCTRFQYASMVLLAESSRAGY